jgi:hypothetical protein
VLSSALAHQENKAAGGLALIKVTHEPPMKLHAGKMEGVAPGRCFVSFVASEAGADSLPMGRVGAFESSAALRKLEPLPT